MGKASPYHLCAVSVALGEVSVESSMMSSQREEGQKPAGEGAKIARDCKDRRMGKEFPTRWKVGRGVPVVWVTGCIGMVVCVCAVLSLTMGVEWCILGATGGYRWVCLEKVHIIPSCLGGVPGW